MIEIKFRAYDEEANVMVYSDEHNLIDYSYEYFFEVLKDKVICVFLVDYDDSFGAPVTDRCEIEKVMQYTGLHDKNKKDIYDGDIIKYKDKTDNGIGLVRFHKARYEAVWIDKSYLRKDLYFWAKKREIEIIGNIYENPELLENKQL